MKQIFFLSVLLSGLVVSSCSDAVDESNLATFVGETVTSHLTNNAEFSDFSKILARVKLSKRSSSTLSELLSARGNYTVFAPTNAAIRHFLDSMYATPGYDLAQLPDSTAELIAKNCIIDHKDVKAYKSADFPEAGPFEKTSLNDRYITVSYSVNSDDELVVCINSKSKVIQLDIEVVNGMIHAVDKVLSPSTAMLPELIVETPNLQIFGRLLQLTGYDRQMQRYRDFDYEDWILANPTGKNQGGVTVNNPSHRNFGYTVFAETDSVLEKDWGVPRPTLDNGIITNFDEILAVLRQRCAEAYPKATSADLMNENNAINQFVSYHIVPMRIPYDKLVIHYTERGYAYLNPSVLSINCFEYYETMGAGRRLMKITEGRTTAGKRINRYQTYDPTNYEELTVPRPGVLILETNGAYDFNALNGYYYTLSNVLVYDEGVPNIVLNERLRFDISSILPEMITNGFRRLMDGSSDATVGVHIPAGYFDNITFNGQGTNYTYLPGYNQSWPDLQGDEHNIIGQYDFTIKLPPVPYEGTWEVRWAIPTYESRGMAQFYFGKNKDNLPAIGLPVDLRRYPSTYGWKADTGDEETDLENDKAVRNQGYVKPPLHDGSGTGSNPVTNSLRNSSLVNYLRMRRIIYTGTMKPDEVYYLRVKSVLENTSTQFVMDWLELVPKFIFNGPVAEDRW